MQLWAKRKKLKGVYEHYRRLSFDIEILLNRYQMHTPLLTFLAGLIYDFAAQIKPAPRYHQGYAAMYSRRGVAQI